MKSQKLIVIAAIVCLLVGVSSAAMAGNDCPEGSIAGGTFDEIVITDFVDCSVVGVHVTGRILVKGANHFTMMGSLVDGNVRVINTVSAVLVDNQVEGNLVTRSNTFSAVLRNVVINGGSIRVNDTLNGCAQISKVSVLQNLVSGGKLRVNCNEEADVKDNKVTNGDITCRDNDRLDSKDNDAIGGKVNCSKSLFD